MTILSFFREIGKSLRVISYCYPFPLALFIFIISLALNFGFFYHLLNNFDPFQNF